MKKAADALGINSKVLGAILLFQTLGVPTAVGFAWRAWADLQDAKRTAQTSADALATLPQLVRSLDATSRAGAETAKALQDHLADAKQMRERLEMRDREIELTSQRVAAEHGARISVVESAVVNQGGVLGRMDTKIDRLVERAGTSFAGGRAR